ncbi:hypothetical protein ACFVVM_16770 [Nocardia sp. NPDC058176]|uniref:hypothetical protein n=1 Tax=Nocardia sp. NPDC058176 TaxID=3346368 RepID=UPI0036D9B006
MTANTHTTADPADTHTRPADAVCPLQVGDEVTGRHDRTWRATIRRAYHDEGVPEFAIETSTGAQGSAKPWELAPADEAPSPQWLDQMHHYQRAHRDAALARVRRDQDEAAGQAEELAQQLTTIATTLRAGRFPDPDQPDSVEFDSAKLADALADLLETREHLLHSGLLSATEIRRYLALDD